jgi:hypothetical protein
MNSEVHMRALTPTLPLSRVTLHRHLIVIVPQLLTQLLVGMALMAVGILRHAPIPFLAGLFLALILNIYLWMAWRIFRIHVQQDRIVIRRLGFGGIRNDIYPIPGRHGMTCRQTWIGRRINAGAITLYLPNHTIHLTKLTPFASAANILGLDH